MNAERLMMLGGIAAFLITIYWVRGRDLRERYALAWLGLSGLLLILGIFPELIMRGAEYARLSYPAAVLFISLAAIYFFSFFVTVSLTRQHRRNIRLMQEIAILRYELKQVSTLMSIVPDRPHPGADEKRA